LDFDLSDVLFICTSNSLNIPPALRDRMEIIRLAGYTEEEKLQIGLRHLLPKAMEDNGLKKNELMLDEKVVRDIIRYYTREAGVRSLKRSIDALCRKAVKEILLHTTKSTSKSRAKSAGKRKAFSITVTTANLSTYLGVRQFTYGVKDTEDQVGVVTGLAWT